MTTETLTPVTANGVDSVASTSRTSGIVAALERAWAAIKDRHPDLPDVVIVMASGTVGMRPGVVRLGHFAVERWTVGHQSGGRLPEMFVAGEGLQRGAVEVLGTLLHEGAHGIAAVRGVKDTSRQGRWHNAKFKAIGEELGLVITKSMSLPIGWSDTAVPAATAAAYADVVADLQAAITMWRRAELDITVTPTGPKTGDGSGTDGEGDGEDAGPAKPKGSVSAICGCESPRRIRIALSVLELGPITCGQCGQRFQPPTT